MEKVPIYKQVIGKCIRLKHTTQARSLVRLLYCTLKKIMHCEHGPNGIIGISLNSSALQKRTRIIHCEAVVTL